jgi:hypothetical protein
MVRVSEPNQQGCARDTGSERIGVKVARPANPTPKCSNTLWHSVDDESFSITAARGKAKTFTLFKKSPFSMRDVITLQHFSVAVVCHL